MPSTFSDGLRFVHSLLGDYAVIADITKDLSIVQTLRAITKGESQSVTYWLRGAGRDYILKVHDRSTRYVNKEAKAIRLCAGHLQQHGLRVPQVVFAEGERLPAFILFRKIPGPTAQEAVASSRLDVISRVAEQIATFRRITFETYGEIAGVYEPAPNHRDLSTYTAQLVDFWRGEIDRHVPMASMPTLKRCLAFDLPTSSELASKPCLCHTDVRPSNIIMGSSGLTIIDYDAAYSYTPEFDLSMLHLSIQRAGWAVPLSQLCDLAASPFGTSAVHLEASIKRFYWILAMRHIRWNAIRGQIDAMRRIHQVLSQVYGPT